MTKRGIPRGKHKKEKKTHSLSGNPPKTKGNFCCCSFSNERTRHRKKEGRILFVNILFHLLCVSSSSSFYSASPSPPIMTRPRMCPAVPAHGSNTVPIVHSVWAESRSRPKPEGKEEKGKMGRVKMRRKERQTFDEDATSSCLGRANIV